MHFRVLRGAALTLVALIGTAALVVTASMSTLVQLAATALIMGGTGMKVLGAPHQWGAGTYVDQVNSTYLSGYHLGEDDLKWVSTPEQFWPSTSLTDISFDTSVARGVLSLSNAVQTTLGEKVVVGYSQSANIATREKRNLADLRAHGAAVPTPDQLSFVFVANPNRPNGGILSRFEGLYIPILGVSFDGATPDDEYRTIDVARQYDLVADFPKYPINLLADANALMGYFLLHPNYGSDVVNLNDPSTYDSYKSGNTTYYLVHTEHLPLLQPFRSIGVLNPVADLIEPTLRVLIELAYDRTPAHMGVPTPAGLLPHINLDKLASDLRAAAKEGMHNALADLGVHTDNTADHHTENVAALDEPAADKPTLKTSVPEGPPSAHPRLRLDMHPTTITDTRAPVGTDNPKLGAETKDPETKMSETKGPETKVPETKVPETKGPEVKTDPDTADTAGADTKTKTEVKAEVKTKTPLKPKSMPERIRQTLRQALSPKKAPDDKAAVSGDAGPIRKTRSDESDSSQPKSTTADTKDRETEGKSRRQQRATHSNAA